MKMGDEICRTLMEMGAVFYGASISRGTRRECSKGGVLQRLHFALMGDIAAVRT